MSHIRIYTLSRAVSLLQHCSAAVEGRDGEQARLWNDRDIDLHRKRPLRQGVRHALVGRLDAAGLGFAGQGDPEKSGRS